jgi:peptidylprolyl isomerase
MKKIIPTIIFLALLAIGSYFLYGYFQKNTGQQPAALDSAPGLKIEILKEGTGAGAQNGDTVTVNYTGTLEDGTKFDSSFDRNQPFSFQLGTGYVIKGWDLGILGMKAGEERKLTIPPDLGYGSRTVGAIPANSTLLFDVQLLKIEK